MGPRLSSQRSPPVDRCSRIAGVREELSLAQIREKRPHTPFSELRPPRLHMPRKAPQRSAERKHRLRVKWCSYPEAASLESISAKRCTHMREDPEISQIQTQNPAKQDDCSKETWKKCPIK